MESNATSVAEQKPRAPAETANHDKNRTLPNIGDVFNPDGMFNGIWVPESSLKCPDLSSSANLLYGRLARFAGENGRCFPSVETLATELDLTARQVQRLLGQLRSAGFLRKDSQYRPNGLLTSNAHACIDFSYCSTEEGIKQAVARHFGASENKGSFS